MNDTYKVREYFWGSCEEWLFGVMWRCWLAVHGMEVGCGRRIEWGAWQEWGYLLWTTVCGFTRNIPGGNRGSLVSRRFKIVLFILLIEGLISWDRFDESELFLHLILLHVTTSGMLSFHPPYFQLSINI